jgi:hypothetical protein
MIVIEAVRTSCWNAITGQRTLATVEECATELRSGDASRPGYVPVTEADLARLQVQSVSTLESARFRLKYSDADGMDAGERDLMAHAATRTDDFAICSSDKAAVRAAHAFGWLDRLVSLESLAASVGARPRPSLRAQFTESRMSEWRTTLRLGGSF